MSDQNDQEHKMTEKERYELQNFVDELDDQRGSGTELVSIYIPKDYNIDKIRTMVTEEKGTASNIKSKKTRDNVKAALSRIEQHLKLFPETPENGLAIFAGDVSDRDGQQDVELWSIEPPLPINQRLYRCDKTFNLEPLKQIADDSNTYGMIVMDRREGNLALLKGKNIVPLISKTSNVPGKFKAGGQCLPANTVVQRNDGSLRTIDNIKIGDKIISLDQDTNKLLQSKVEDAWKTGRKQRLSFTTKHPRLTIDCSPDHTFLVKTGNGIDERTAKEIEEGATLLTPSKIPVDGTIQTINAATYYNSYELKKQGQQAITRRRQTQEKYQRELADEINVEQSTISAYEEGSLNIHRTTLRRLAEALNIPLQRFLKTYTTPYCYKDIRLPTEADRSFAYLIGYYAGDGYLEDDRLECYEGNHDFATDFAERMSAYLDTDVHLKRRDDKNYTRIRITSRPLVRLIRNECPEIRGSTETRTPDLITQSPDRVVAGYLSGLLDAEGHARPERGVAISLNNERLIRETHHLLLRHGVLSSLRTYDNQMNPHSDKTKYTLDITEKESLIRFKERIGFHDETKADRLDEAIKAKTNKSNNRQVLISGTETRRILSNHGYQPHDFPEVSLYFQDKRMMSKHVFQENILSNVNEACGHELQEAIDAQVVPTTVQQKEKNGEASMWDISVQKSNFIGNAIITHNSAQRFARIREGEAKKFYKKIARMAKEQFYSRDDLQGILVGGPGHTKNEFVDDNYLPQAVKDEIIAVKDLSYTGEYGLEELLEKSQDVLSKESVAREKSLMQEFFTALNTEPGTVTYGPDQTMKAVKMGAVDTLLVSEDVDEDTVERFIEEAEKVSSDVEIISTDTTRGQQLSEIGGIAAILRYNAGGTF